MEAKIVDLPKLYFIGLKAELTMKEINQVGPALWDELMSRAQDLDKNPNLMCLGLSLTPQNCGENDTATYMAGFASDKPLPPKEGFVTHEVTQSKYAVFTHKGSVMKLGETFDYAYNEWLPNSEYTIRQHEDLELYDNRFDESNPDKSEMDIYIPIQ